MPSNVEGFYEKCLIQGQPFGNTNNSSPKMEAEKASIDGPSAKQQKSNYEKARATHATILLVSFTCLRWSGHPHGGSEII